MLFESRLLDEIKGIGPKKQSLLNKIGVYDTYDLLNYFPSAYKDMRHLSKICEIEYKDSEKEILILGRVISTNLRTGRFSKGGYVKSQTFKLFVGDETGKIEMYYFNAGYMSKILHKGKECYFYGKVKKLSNGHLAMIQPEVIEKKDIKPEIVPVYKMPKGIAQKEVTKIVREELEKYIKDPLNDSIVSKRNLMPYKKALENIHFPINESEYKRAKYRMVYQNLFLMELGIETMKNDDLKGHIINISYEIMKKELPFELTKAQEKVMFEIESDLKSGRQMNRLLQGDVGSGKTAVAMLALYMVISAGFQGVMMAPTEILAKQHYETLNKEFEKFGYKTALLTGSMTKKQKEKVAESIKSGEIQLILGTHAVIQDYVQFDNLGMVITDEQHRFGVNQRVKIANKGKAPHIMVMTATPIPRTLAVIAYGNLDISVLDAMPKGRKPIITQSVSKNDRERMYLEALKEVQKGRQVYVVASRIGSEDQPIVDGKILNNEENLLKNSDNNTSTSNPTEIKSVESLYEEITKIYEKYGVKIEMLHGEMKQREKDEIMNRFNSGQIQVLISTVVIEVGINVPNATVMIIEDANRFGLSQLHQLRGRIGRGEHQSYCFLVSDRKGEIANKRIDLMCESSDGFFLAEKDLELRGPGEIFGTRQHGEFDEILHLAIRYKNILSLAKEDVRECKGEISKELFKMMESLYNNSNKLNL